MGFLSEIKRLLFAKKAVSKSAYDKSKEYVKDKAEDLSESAKEFKEDTSGKISEKTSGLRDAVMDTADELSEKGKDVWEDLSGKAGKVIDDIADKAEKSESVRKAADFSEKVGDKVLDAGEKTMKKAKDLSEKVGEEVLDKGKILSDKAKEMSEDVGEKVIAAKEDLVKRAKEAADKVGDKMDETMEKAEKMAEEEAAKPKKDFADEDLSDSGDSLLDGTDDFFAKAARYAEGDYGSMLEGKTEIIESEEPLPKKPPGKAAGFEDLDGDGNELIDDAIISEEE